MRGGSRWSGCGVGLAAALVCCVPEPAADESAPAPAPPPAAEKPAPATVPDLPPEPPPITDHEGPEIRVLTPARAANVPLSAPVEVRLEVKDAESELGEVTVGGDAVTIDETGRGVHTLTPKTGLNVILVSATDEHGNASRLVQSFYAAPSYRVTESWAKRQAMIPGAVSLWLGQIAIDAGRVNRPADGHPRDLASVVELVIAGIKADVLVGQRVKIDASKQAGFTGTATVKGFERGAPRVNLVVRRADIALRATIPDIKIRLGVDGRYALGRLRVDATVKARQLALSGKIAATVGAGGRAEVKVRDLSVDFQGLEVSVDNRWGSAVNWLIDAFRGDITRTLEREISDQIARQLDGPLAQALDGLAGEQTVTIPGVSGGPDVTLELRSALESLAIQPGGIAVSLSGSATTTKRVEHEFAGAVVRGECRADDPAPSARPPVEIGVDLDLANQLLAALWQAGLFNVSHDLTPEAREALPLHNIDRLSVDVDPLLPPLLLDCGNDGALELQIGDVGLKVNALVGTEPTEIELFASAATHVSVTHGEGGALALEVDSPRVLETDVVAVRVAGEEVSSPAQIAFFEGALTLASARMLGMFRGTLAQLPLPVLDLSTVAPGIPRGAVIAPEVDDVTTRAGALTIGGHVR